MRRSLGQQIGAVLRAAGLDGVDEGAYEDS